MEPRWVQTESPELTAAGYVRISLLVVWMSYSDDFKREKESVCLLSARANLSCPLPLSLHTAISVEKKGFVFLFHSFQTLQNRLMKQWWSGHFMCFPRIRIMNICFVSLLITRVQVWKHLYTLTLKNDALLTHRVPAQQNWLTNIVWIQRCDYFLLWLSNSTTLCGGNHVFWGALHHSFTATSRLITGT